MLDERKDYEQSQSVMEAFRQMQDYGSVEATCTDCGAERTVEPDAREYACQSEGCEGTLSSPLHDAGMI